MLLQLSNSLGTYSNKNTFHKKSVSTSYILQILDTGSLFIEQTNAEGSKRGFVKDLGISDHGSIVFMIQIARNRSQVDIIRSIRCSYCGWVMTYGCKMKLVQQNKRFPSLKNQTYFRGDVSKLLNISHPECGLEKSLDPR